MGKKFAAVIIRAVARQVIQKAPRFSLESPDTAHALGFKSRRIEGEMNPELVKKLLQGFTLLARWKSPNLRVAPRDLVKGVYDLLERFPPPRVTGVAPYVGKVARINHRVARSPDPWGR